MKNEIVVDGRELMSTVTLSVRMPRLFGLRMWLATKLFELAATVTGFNVVIEVDDED
jgi:hypothetical protein